LRKKINVTMMAFEHPLLGLIRGAKLGAFTQFRSIPYASIEQRFARSKLLEHLPKGNDEKVYDATAIGPCCIQPEGGAKMDADSNQLPADIIEDEQEQSEDCMRVTITAPTEKLGAGRKMPVVG